MTSNYQGRKVNMTSGSLCILSLSRLLSGIFDDDFGISKGGNFEEEGEGIYAYPGDVVALGNAVTTVIANGE